MRAAEWVNLSAFCFLAIVGWRRHLPRPRRAKANAIAAVGIAAIGLAVFAGPRVLPPLAASVVRDWLPYVLMLMVYWQAGQFFTRVDTGIQEKLVQLDGRMVTPLLARLARDRAGRSILTGLEIAYLFCYPVMPMSLAALYLMRMGHEADYLWKIVLVSSYLCYCMLPFIQTHPPRKLAWANPVLLPKTKMRALNLWVLGHASIHANTFPSAHVASSTACALVLLRLAPGVGLAFLALAISIALGAVAGRYHYAADVALGALVALVVFWAGM
jgi:hypothetical protein